MKKINLRPRRFQKILFAAIAALFCFSIASAEMPVSVTAALNRTSAFVGEELQLTIQVQGEFESVQRPKLPPLESFQSFYVQQSSKFFYSETKKSYLRTVVFTFTLIPGKAGKYSVGPFEIPLEKEVYKTEPIALEVTAAPQSASAVPTATATNPSPQMVSSQTGGSYSGLNSSFNSSVAMTQSSLPRGADRDLFLKVWADKKIAYPGEQITVTYSVYTRFDTTTEGFREEPNVKGFWMEDLGRGENIKQQMVSFNGRRYMQADIRKMALFATGPGEYVIEPGSLNCSVQQVNNPPDSQLFGSFFNDQFFNANLVAKREQRVLGAEPITVVIQPFPEKNKPQEFNNLTGIFSVTATVDKETVKVNEPIQVQVTMQGKGNIETLSQPLYKQDPDTFRVIDSESTSKILKINDMITGWKKFSFVFIPRKEGTFTIGPFRTVYFDPMAERYEFQQSKSFSVTVTPGRKPEETTPATTVKPAEKPATGPADEIKAAFQKIQEENISEKYRHTLRTSLYMLEGLNGIALLGLFFVGILRQRQKRRENNPRFYRFRDSYKIFRHQFNRIKKKSRSKKEEVRRALFSEISRVVLVYFSNKFDIHDATLTQVTLVERLKEAGIPEKERTDVIHLLQDCDFVRFSAAAGADEKLSQILAEAEKIVKNMEAKIVSPN